MPALECECVQATVPAVEFSSPESPVLLCSPGFLCFSVISHQSSVISFQFSVFSFQWSVVSGQWSGYAKSPFFWGGGEAPAETKDAAARIGRLVVRCRAGWQIGGVLRMRNGQADVAVYGRFALIVFCRGRSGDGALQRNHGDLPRASQSLNIRF